MAPQDLRRWMVVASILVGIIHECSCYAEINLTEAVFKNYSKEIRPQVSARDPVRVAVRVTFLQLLRIDEKEEVMTFSVWIRMIWNDTRLAWKPSSYDQIKWLHADVDNLWRPDIHILNSVDPGEIFSSTSEGDLTYRASLHHHGYVKYARPMIVKSSCEMSIADYPYDSQTCTLNITSWAHDRTMINLDIDDGGGIEMAQYIPSEGWNDINITVQRIEKRYDCCKEPFGTLIYKITIRRASLFYSINYVLPALNLVFLSLLMFTVPPEVGKRMECGINLLLCVAVYLILVNAKVPSTSLEFPVLSKFYGCAIFILVIGMYCTTSVYAYYFHDPTGRGIYLMNHKFKVVVLYWMARIFLFPHGYRKAPDGSFVLASSLSWGHDSEKGKKTTNQVETLQHKKLQTPPNIKEQAMYSKTTSSKLPERNDSGYQESDKYPSFPSSRHTDNDTRSTPRKSSRVTPEGEETSTRRPLKKRNLSVGSRRGKNPEKIVENDVTENEAHRPRSVDSGKPSSPERDKPQHSSGTPSMKFKQQSSDSLWSSLSSNSSLSLSSHSPETPANIILESPLQRGKENTSKSMEIIKELLQELASDDEDTEFDTHTEEASAAEEKQPTNTLFDHESAECQTAEHDYYIDDLADVIEDQVKRGLSDEEWRKAGRVFNRMFIVVLILSIIISGIACFVS